MVGVEIVGAIRSLQAEARIIRDHHYRQGYLYHGVILKTRPDEQVAIESQILAAADIFDALTSPRANRSGYFFTAEAAFEIVETGNCKSGYGQPIDPKIITALKEIVLSPRHL